VGLNERFESRVKVLRRSVIKVAVRGRRDRLGVVLVVLVSCLVVALVAVVTALIALAVNAVSDLEEWPAGLDLIQEYPVPSLVVLLVLAAVLGRLALSVQRAGTAGVDAGDGLAGPGRMEGGTRTAVVDAPFGEAPPVVRGRDDVVASLLDVPAAGGRRVRVVSGMGGGGKTTVALAAAQAARGLGWRVWWVSAADAASLVAGMSAVAVEAGAPAEEVSGAESDVALAGVVWRWVEQAPGRWLLVIDNADDPGALAPAGTSVAGGTGWVREAGSGLVVVTSRVGDPVVWGSRVSVVGLGMLDSDSAARMLLDRMGLLGEGDQLRLAREVAARLGYLPLALHLAGSYLGSGLAEVGLAGFLEVLEARSLRMLDLGAPGWGVNDPRRQVLSTWEISLDALAAQGRPQARELLRVLSFLAPGAVVPVAMLDSQVIAAAGVFTTGDGRAEAVAAGLGGLRAVGLVDSVQAGPSGGDGVVVHPLVAEISRLHADQTSSIGVLVGAAAGLVIAAGRGLDPEAPRDRSGWQLLAPHALAVLRHAASLPPEVAARVVGVNNALTHHLARLGSHAAAIDLAGEVSSVAEQLLGAEHPDTLTSRNNLASAYQAAGRLGEAIPLFEATLAARERVLGAEHPDTLTSRNNLAGAYDAAGRLGEAIPLYEATLAAYERVLGAEHPDTLGSRNNLAYAYQAAGRLGEAIPLYEATLAASERVLGAEHPATLTSRNNLAGAYQAAGRLGEAIPLYEATLAASERVLGAEHPATLSSRNNLAGAYDAAGRLGEAIPLYEATLAARERVLGAEHPATLTSRNNLAAAYEDRARGQEVAPPSPS
jgi:tetratricopeptide (TPR) repeat protein